MVGLKWTYLILSLLLSFVMLLLSTPSRAFDLIELDSLAIDYKNYKLLSTTQRDLLIYPESPYEGINVEINSSLFFDLMYFNSTIEGLTTSAQYRGIGLQERVGFRVFNILEVGWYHHSQHVLDREIQSIPTFPAEDAIELKLYLYKRK